MNIHPGHTTAVQGFNVGYGLLQRDHIFLLADSLFSITENVANIISAIPLLVLQDSESRC